MVDDEIEMLRIQSHNDIESFVKEFTKKYRRLFKNGLFACRVFSGLTPKFFPYEVYLEIKVRE